MKCSRHTGKAAQLDLVAMLSLVADACPSGIISLGMQLFHLVDRKSVDNVLREGLRYGSQGVLSRDEAVASTNGYLDSVRPARLAALGLSRNKCIYLYLAMEGRIHDICDGRLRELSVWAAEQPQAVLAAEIDTAAAYLSDLDAYDAVRAAVTAGAPADTLERLAVRYWESILPLTEIVQYYRLRADGLVLRAGSPGRLPARIRRAEVMAVRSILPQALSLLEYHHI